MADDFAESIAHDERLLALPVEPYLGLTLRAAEALAREEGRFIRVLETVNGPRHLDLRPARVNIALNDDGLVVAVDAG